ncbi:MAG: GNAT family N-acetyltransferase [bacterium]
MLLEVRAARAEDATVLVDLYGRAYSGGYAASFDRYGPIKPRDFWWIQSEKEVLLVEINRRPAGLIMLGRRETALVVEEVLGDLIHSVGASSGGRPDPPSREERAALARLGAHLLAQVRRERIERLVLRCAENNPLALALARHLEMPFANLLVVTSLQPRRQTARPPDGYAIRRAIATDAGEMARIYEECYPAAPAADEVARAIARPQVRAWVAERQRYLTGFLLAEAHPGGFGDLVAGVREAHRRRGLGRALAAGAMSYFAGRHIPAVGLHWGPDGLAGAFYRALGFATERVYLFFERTF